MWESLLGLSAQHKGLWFLWCLHGCDLGRGCAGRRRGEVVPTDSPQKRQVNVDLPRGRQRGDDGRKFEGWTLEAQSETSSVCLTMTVENKYKIIRSSQTGSSGDGGSSSKWDEALPGIGRMVYFNQISRPARRGEIAIKSTRLSKRMMGGPADAMGPSRRINKRGGRDLVVGKALWRACSVVG